MCNPDLVGDEAVVAAAGPGEPAEDLTAVLSKIARTLEPEADVDRAVEHIVRAAAATVPGADEAGVSLLESGTMRSVAPSSDVVAHLDQLQHRLHEGPCVDAIHERPVYRTGDIGADPRWPRFGREAASSGVSSMLGFKLFTSTSTIGALNLYSWRTDAFDDDAERIGELFAAHAAVALAGSQGLAHLHVALRTRDTIGMAKGILMERHGVDADRAFALLVEASQHANLKLRDAAEWLVSQFRPEEVRPAGGH
ncbi:GAF and ANTAR domain-containing protein [Saccharomonospora iraqiensis]|uniref:GAF and ANTAR domain-containing protein n=1 Tax=Saccharomonospora iraqiensis TaxID=52698 RepID=UPI00022E2049|nr:GAF and ANTAR domain-containing protein [Saccharomonospora iraqiensis]